jgi:hypothetical protein
MSVTEDIRLLRPAAPAAGAAGAFGSSTLVYFTVSSATTLSAPAPSTLTSAACADAPWPRITERYELCDFGCTARSVIAICWASVPKSAAIF